MSVKSSLTVMFEAPFWIGVYERFDEGYYEFVKSLLVVNLKTMKFTIFY